MTRRRLVASIALGLAGGVGCGEDEPSGPPGPKAPPGIVVFCFDTLREDAALGGENGVPYMPALAEFAKGATQFEEASASAAWTAPSVATLLTGLVPWRHGVETEHHALVPAAPTVAERLAEQGWHTAAFTGGGWLVPQMGLGQGFDRFEPAFDDPAPDGGPETLLARWEQARPRGKPFFLFLHTYAAHDPYGPQAKSDTVRGVLAPEETAFAERVKERMDRGETVLPDEDRRRFLVESITDGRARNSYAKVLGRERMRTVIRQSIQWLDEGFPRDPQRVEIARRVRSAYLAGLAYADELFRRTLAALDHLPKETVFVVTADHGEAFGEHGTLMHGRWLFDEMVRVPLLVRAQGRLAPGPARGSCGLVDLAPTIFALAGVPGPGDLDGRSILPIASGGPGNPVVAQELRDEMIGGGLAGTYQVTVRTERVKFVADVGPATRSVRESLYDLAADPGEASPKPAQDLGRFGDPFVDAVNRLRASIRDRLR